jgi:hypothetical protein
MIPKVVKARDGVGSGGTSFSGAVGYVAGKADHVETRNLASLETAAAEMRAVARESDRLKKPVYHFLLSWAELEQPTNQQMMEAADSALMALGLESHQAVIAIHRDRDHQHVHVVVNKRGLDGHAADLRGDYRTLEQVCRQIEAQQGWARDRGHFEVVFDEAGEVRLVPKAEVAEHGPSRGDAASERRTGAEPLAELLRRDDMHQSVAEVIDGAKSWDDLHQGLDRLGLRYQAKGSGAKLVAADGAEASPSHVDKGWARRKLETRLGVFTPATAQAPTADIRQIAAASPSKALYAEARERLWQRFRTESIGAAEAAAWSRRAERHALRQRHQTEAEHLVARQRNRGRTLYKTFGSGILGSFFRAWNAQRKRKEWAELKARQAQERQRHKGDNKATPRPEWRTWLSQQATHGDADAQMVVRHAALARSRDEAKADGYGNSAAELEAMRRLDLPSIARELGYEVDERDSAKASVKLRRGAEVVIARPGREGWEYFSTTNDNDSGGVLQFVQKRRGGTLGEVRAFLRPMLKGVDQAAMTTPAPAAERDHTAARQAWMAATAGMPRYLLGRGIDPATVDHVARDQVREDRRGNVLFAHHDSAGNILGFEVKGGTWSGFAKGGQKTLAVFGADPARRDPARIVVVESGIDALSLAQIEQRRDTLYVSTGGAIGRRSLDELRTLCAQHPHAVLSLGFDRDEAGERLAQRVTAEIGRTTVRLTPKGKDWNDDVMAAKAPRPAPVPEREQAEQQRQRVRTRSRGRGI